MTKLELTEAFNITQRTPRRVAVKYIVMPLSQEEIDGCREAFNKFDKDGSGTVRDPKLLFLVSLAMARTNTYYASHLPLVMCMLNRLMPLN